MSGGGALALIALAAAAVALARRRRETETVDYDTATVDPAPEPVVEEPRVSVEPAGTVKAFQSQPAFVAPPLSAFNWRRPPQSTTKTGPATDETWVERAYRGPSPENPSLSLRKRLKRAAFFDKRDREAAAGLAPAVDPDAGLPDNSDTREFEAA